MNIYKLVEETIRMKLEHEEEEIAEQISDYIDAALDVAEVVEKMLDGIDFEEMALDILNE